MILNIKSIMIIVCALILCALPATAQNLQSLENNFNTLELKLREEQTRLDSLNKILNNMVEKIDVEKEKKVYDKNGLSRLMASSITVSNEIDSQSEQIEQLQRKINLSEEILIRRYASIIDSLKAIKTSAENDIDKNKLEAEISFYTEKKLNISPRIGLLSFHPRQILKLDPEKIHNPSEKEMYRKYLRNALLEVNDRLKNVIARGNEIDRVLVLKKKSQKFLRETEFESNVRPLSSAIPSSELAQDTRTGSVLNPGEDAYALQVQSYSLLLNQLNDNQSENSYIRHNKLSSSKSPPLSIEEYKELMNEVKTRLEEYKIVLLHKLGMIK